MNAPDTYLQYIVDSLIQKLDIKKHTQLMERLNAQVWRFENPLSDRHAHSLANILEKTDLEEALLGLIPWRKGPYNIQGIELDAEWDCTKKWDRLAPLLPNMMGKRVLDVGSGNGYFSLKCAEQNPEWVLAIDPSALFFLQFQAAKTAFPDAPVQFVPLGWQDLDLFESEADVVLCFKALPVSAAVSCSYVIFCFSVSLFLLKASRVSVQSFFPPHKSYIISEKV